MRKNTIDLLSVYNSEAFFYVNNNVIALKFVKLDECRTMFYNVRRGKSRDLFLQHKFAAKSYVSCEIRGTSFRMQ